MRLSPFATTEPSVPAARHFQTATMTFPRRIAPTTSGNRMRSLRYLRCSVISRIAVALREGVGSPDIAVVVASLQHEICKYFALAAMRLARPPAAHSVPSAHHIAAYGNDSERAGGTPLFIAHYAELAERDGITPVTVICVPEVRHSSCDAPHAHTMSLRCIHFAP